MMHGAMYLIMKTEDRIFARLTIMANNTSKFFILCFMATSMATLIYVPHMTDIFKSHPELFILPIAAVLIVLNIRRSIEKRQYRRGFVSSSITTALLLILFAMGLYPNLVLSNADQQGNISIYEAASSDGSLKTMLLFAFIGMPLVATYTIFMFWTFRGKVKLEEHSY
jgi:cytochrome d ubiquinol oxidase subunit II